MYLSRVRVAAEGLDRNTLVQIFSGDAYANHQLLWRLFTDSTERPFLFRQEMEQEQLRADKAPRGLPLFYLLSSCEPVSLPGLLECESKYFDPKLAVGDQLLFKLRANPTVARKKDGEKHSRRHDVLMDAKCRFRKEGKESPEELRHAMDGSAVKWLADRSKGCGFQLATTPQVSGYRQHQWQRKRHRIRFSSVDYEGVITVTDPDKMRTVLFDGVGRSRAFGCGMIMVRRA